MEAILIITVLVLLGGAAARWGCDSRDNRDWQPRPDTWAYPRRKCDTI